MNLSFLENLSIGKIIGLLLGVVVMATVLMLNAVFTFSYGYDVIGPFLLLNQVGLESSAILSGLVAVLFYDVAYVAGFVALLLASDSIWQYAVLIVQFIICLTLSILASVTSIIILSPLGEYVPETLLLIVRYVGYGGLVIGFIINALASIGYITGHPRVAEMIRQSVRVANDLSTQLSMIKRLDSESRRLAKDSINEEIPRLAQMHAEKARQQYLISIGQDPHTYDSGVRIIPLINEGNGFETEVSPAPQRPQPTPHVISNGVPSGNAGSH